MFSYDLTLEEYQAVYTDELTQEEFTLFLDMSLNSFIYELGLNSLTKSDCLDKALIQNINFLFINGASENSIMSDGIKKESVSTYSYELDKEAVIYISRHAFNTLKACGLLNGAITHVGKCCGGCCV